MQQEFKEFETTGKDMKPVGRISGCFPSQHGFHMRRKWRGDYGNACS